MATIQEAMNTAVAHHQAGRLPQAEDIYREVLVVRPTHADALHLLGVVALQTGRHEAAVEHIKRAIKLHGTEASFHSNLGEAYRSLQKLTEAEASCRRAVELKDDYPEAHYNLALVLAKLGRHEEASKHFRRTSELKPADADAPYFLGLSLGLLNRIDEAMANFRRAIALKPDYALAHLNLGHILKDRRQFEEAVVCYRRVLELTPKDVGAHINLGQVLKVLGRLDEAIVCYQRAVDLKPEDAGGHNNLAIALAERGRLDDAIASYRRALHQKPDYAGAHSNLGNALAERGRMEDAIASYRRALDLEPDFTGAHVNLGNALRDRGRLDEAIASYQRALELKPDDPMTLSHLGTTQKDQGRLVEAVANYRRALQLVNDRGTNSSLLFTLNFCPGYDGPTLCEEHRNWDRLYAQPLAHLIRPHTNDRSAVRRLRIGYVSPDFRTHCQAFFTIPLLSAHDHSNFEIFCYSDVANADHITQKLHTYADVWRDIAGLNDDRFAEMVRSDRIDVLVDLTMHMSKTRLLTFARKPAPVQVTWLAYPGTTGVSAIDYRLTDVNLDPPGMFEGCYTEESVRLPDTFWCYDPLTTEPGVNPPPVLKKGHITFGNFNNFCKINPDVLKLWAEVLRAVEGSQLVLLTGEGDHREQTLEIVRQAGVAPERIQLQGRRPRLRYLELYHEIDIGLDTIPYNGHTTSLDSFWMGVPVVTLVGQTVVGRAGLCQLKNLGLPELIAETPEEYVRIVVELAKDLPRLSALRAGCERMRVSPLMDGPRFARNVEAAYRTMWQRWCAK